MSQMPDTHQVLLRTMLQYEIDNWIDINIKECEDFLGSDHKDHKLWLAVDGEIKKLELVRNYLQERIKVLT